jgi:hypothetical protein
MIDSEIKNAIRIACGQDGQDDDFANKLIKWVEALSSKSMNASQNSDHLNVVIKSINLGKDKQ